MSYSTKPTSTSDRQIRAELADVESEPMDTRGSTIITPAARGSASPGDLYEALILWVMVAVNCVSVLILFANTATSAALWADGICCGFLLALAVRATASVRRALR